MESLRQVARMLSRPADPAVRDGLDEAVSQALRQLRQDADLDVAFVSRFEEGRRTVEMVDQRPGMDLLAAGTAGPLEQSWCGRVACGQLPCLMIDAAPYVRNGNAPEPGIAIGTHISVPVVLQGGEIFGTLCAFSARVNARTGSLDLRRMQGAALLLANRIARVRAGTQIHAAAAAP